MDVRPLGLAQEASVIGEGAITVHCLLLLLAHLWAHLAAEPQCLPSGGKLLPCLRLWGEPGLQDSSLDPLCYRLPFILPSSSLEPLPPNPLGPHKCATWFLKKAPFFSLIIKLPRNNGCHLKHQRQSSLPTTQ